MRIVIDLQSIQTASAKRGIGRYSRGLVEAILRNSPEDNFVLLLNGMLGECNQSLRRQFEVWPNAEIRIWTAAPPAGHRAPADRRLAAEAIREAVIADIAPDVVLITSLFEGLGDDSVTSVSDVPTAIVFYDLIPFLFPELYLKSRESKDWYHEKLKMLRRADLLLSISECSARDAVTHLSLPPERVTNIGSGVDARFAPRAIDPDTRNMLASDLGLVRPFLMYTGGDHPRKNISALIEAFAGLPKDLSARHQLAIVGQIGEETRVQLLEQARAKGLSRDAVVITGYVNDDQLIALYNACLVLVLPSLYEGFGLPVLEAMRCGAAVVGANTSSIPEVIGRDDALFDPHSIADMIRMIEKVLTDVEFRQSLRDSGPIQAARFSWDETARRALLAMRALVGKRASSPRLAVTTTRKPRLAYVSPLPPERSGISFYSAALLPELGKYYDIDLIVEQDKVEGVDAARFPIRDARWLREHADSYDRVLYQFGNSPLHAHMIDLLADIPGVVVLHDFFLSGLEAHLDPVTFTRILAENHGYHAAMQCYDTSDGRDGFSDAIWSWPANARVIRHAEGIIVHSNHARDLARRFYGAQADENWVLIPHVRRVEDHSDEARAEARAALGFADADLVICSFGYLSRTKAVLRLLDSFLKSATFHNPKAHLVFVGDGDAAKLLARIAKAQLQRRVRVTGWASDELYRRYLQAADFAVQLRANSRGETSGAVLDCQSYGVPLIVNAHGSMAELPSGTVFQIRDGFTDSDLAQAIDTLAGDPELRSNIGTAARNRILSEHAPAACARAYRDAIETFYGRQRAARRDLYKRLVQLPPDPARDAKLAQAVADSLPSKVGLRQLFVDVSTLARSDRRTGIERTVRALLWEWLRHPPSGWRVEPVFADVKVGRYRYARSFTCRFLGIPDEWACDSPIDFAPGDQFLGLDWSCDSVPEMRTALSAMEASGMSISFVVYDLLPLVLPQHFPSGMPQAFSRWLGTIARHEQLICISRSVADQLRAYLNQHRPPNGLMPRISWFHLGADIENSAPTTDLPSGLESQLNRLKTRPNFLMVGTVEPRKGHGLVLSAFEQLWAKGGDANLVIVGKQGWQVEALCKRLRTHPEIGKRLFWLDKVSDAHLERLYKACSCLVAASEDEGFGLPLIEASKHDLPILARDIPVFREVAGAHATYFDGSSPETLLQALEDWLAAQKEGSVVRSGGLPYLTWRESATALLKILGINSDN